MKRTSEARRRKDRSEYDMLKHALAESTKVLGLEKGGERVLQVNRNTDPASNNERV